MHKLNERLTLEKIVQNYLYTKGFDARLVIDMSDKELSEWVQFIKFISLGVKNESQR